MADKEKIKEKYDEVRMSLENAVAETETIELIGEEENNELQAIRSFFSEQSEKFKKEIDALEKNAEWDKFCMAFFGETNAGKSTIIEALRVVYDEEERRKETEELDKRFLFALKDEGHNFEALNKSLSDLREKIKNWKAKLRPKFIGFFVSGAAIGFAAAFLVFKVL